MVNDFLISRLVDAPVLAGSDRYAPSHLVGRRNGIADPSWPVKVTDYEDK